MLKSVSWPLFLCRLCSRYPLRSSSRRNSVTAAPGPTPSGCSRRAPRLISPLSSLASARGVKIVSSTPWGIRFMSTSSNLVPSDSAAAVELLDAIEDKYDGVIVNMEAPMEPESFVSSLRVSLAHWRQQGKKGVWLKLSIELSNLVNAAVKEGFWYHHAEPKYLMLVYWIPDTAHTLPENATHRVGIGAFVMNDKREVLVVQEKNGRLRGTGIWKFPTGVINQSEDIFSGAIREVKEETGIDTEFVEVLAFRQSHKSFFEKSDLFFVCMLRPLSFDIQKQDSEIEAAQWMSIDEYADQDFIQKHELLKYILEVCLAKTGKGYGGFSPKRLKRGFSGDENPCLYLNTTDLSHPPNSANES